MADLTGCVIQHYEVRNVLKSDLTFTIYEVLNQETNEKAVLWIVFPKSQYSPDFAQSLQERLDILSLLEHPNLMPILAYGLYENKVYWITPYVPGQLLSERISTPLQEQEAAAVAKQAADGLEYLHRQNLLHQCLSPETILISDNQQVLLFQYAVTDLLNRKSAKSVPDGMLGYGIGNASYLAPEQILGHEATVQTDIYALGAVFYTLLNGVLPYSESTGTETALKKIRVPLSWPKKLPNKILPTSVRLVHKCMCRQPVDRFENAAEVQKIFERLITRKGTRIHVHKSEMIGAPRPSLSILWLIFSALSLIVAGWFAYQHFGLSKLPHPEVAASLSTSTPVTPGKNVPIPTERITPKTDQTPDQQPEITQTPGAVETPSAVPTPVKSASIQLPVLMGTPLAGKLEVISTENVSQLQEAVRLGLGKFYQVSITPDGKTLAVAASAGVVLIQEGKIVDFYNLNDEATSVQFSWDGSQLAIGVAHGQLLLWDWQTN